MPTMSKAMMETYFFAVVITGENRRSGKAQGIAPFLPLRTTKAGSFFFSKLPKVNLSVPGGSSDVTYR
jgi:hypothetical protein